jgi:GT2 family glycosyltransferase
MSDNRLALAIVTYNSAHQIVECIDKLNNSKSDFSIIVRDNASTDSTPDILRDMKSQRKIDELVLADENQGFAVAVNDVIHRAPKCDILLMNPDARIDSEAITILRNAIAEDPGLGMVAPVVRGDESIRVMSAGRLPTLWPMFTHYSGLSRAFPERRRLRGRHLFLDSHSNNDQVVEWTSGCCVLIPRRTIEQVGVLNERWFMYGEDTEYCKRVLDAGLSIKVLAKAHAFHEVGASAAIEEESDGSPTRRRVADGPPAAHTRLNVMWAVNLYDFYVTEYRPTIVTRLAWKTVFTLGNALRAAARLAAHPGDRKAKRLLKNAFAVWT